MCVLLSSVVDTSARHFQQTDRFFLAFQLYLLFLLFLRLLLLLFLLFLAFSFSASLIPGRG